MWPFKKKRDSSAEGNRTEILDRLLERLMDRYGHMPTPLQFEPNELKILNESVREILQNQSMLIETDAPIKVVGDTHGQFYDVLRLFNFCGDPSETRYLFLGDYVDRGQLGLETLVLLLSLKVKRPNDFWLLRGNHESPQQNHVYGFYDEIKKRFGGKQGTSLWRDFCKTYTYLPVSALVAGRILCMHGGLSPDLDSLSRIRDLPVPCVTPEYGVMCDVLWSDPFLDDGWAENTRGISFSFGPDVVAQFCRRLNIELIVRAHQMCPEGYQFYAGQRVLTIFSAPNYCCPGINNAAAVLKIDPELLCSFEIMHANDDLPLVYLPEKGKRKRKRKKEKQPSSPGK